jgi:uncharacterized membrane protein
MKLIYSYLLLLFYCCIFFTLTLLSTGVIIIFMFFLKNDSFLFSISQIKRAVVFGFITGVVAWIGIIVFKLIDKLKPPPKNHNP